jgi:hypothetical protein
MKIHGYCTVCRRVRLVRVTRPMPGRYQQGVCDQCSEAERERRNRPTQRPRYERRR